MSENLNVVQKIIEVKKAVGGLSKDSKSYGYDYVSGNQILNKIKDKMNEIGLLLVVETKSKEWEKHPHITRQGKEAIDFVVWGDMKLTWVNASDPEDTLSADWVYFGQQDDISKAYGSALTYSERYFLLKALGLPTDEDDPDAKANSKGKGGSKTVSEGQLKRMYAICMQNGWNFEKTKAKAESKYGKKLEELSMEEYDEIIEVLSKKNPKAN